MSDILVREFEGVCDVCDTRFTVLLNPSLIDVRLTSEGRMFTWVAHIDPAPDANPQCARISSMVDEKLYTLPEAQRALGRLECTYQGHLWDVLEEMSRGPTWIKCYRCGESRPIGNEQGES